ELVQKAKGISNVDNLYTTDSLSSLSVAIEEAENALLSLDSVEGLKGAISALQKGLEDLKVDVSDLETLIVRAKEIDNAEGLYTETSYEALQTAITEAEKALPTIDNLESRTAAVSDLREALNNLTVDVSDLEALIAKAKEIDNAEGLYTETSYEALQTAISEAEKALPTIDSLESRTAAVSELHYALNNLTVDVSDLETLLAKAKEIDNADGLYTAASYEALQTEITEAEKSLPTIDSLESRTAAVSDLQDALNNLTVDVSNLEALIAKAKEIDNADGLYAAASYEALQTAITEAEKSLPTIDSLKSRTTAVSDLQAALNGLVKVKPNPNPDVADKKVVNSKEDLKDHGNGIFELEIPAKSVAISKEVLEQLGEYTSIILTNGQVNVTIPVALLQAGADIKFNFSEVSDVIAEKN